MKVGGWTPDAFFFTIFFRKATSAQRLHVAKPSDLPWFWKVYTFSKNLVFLTFRGDFGVYFGSFLGALGSFSRLFGVPGGCPNSEKGRPKRNPKGPPVCAGSNGEKCVGPKRRASSHQEGPRPRPRPDPEPNQSPYPDQTQNQNQNQRQRQRTET